MVSAVPIRQWQVLTIGFISAALLAISGFADNANGDFENRGCMNPTVYNESTGEWRTLTDRNDYNPESFFFGGPGWTAIQSDYDGDGIADVAIYNRGTGQWTALLSSNGYKILINITFGGEGWVVVTGDYDGDRLNDPTIYCEATGEWRTKLSSSGHTQTNFVYGGPGHTAVSGDYDGDGISDPGVYRVSDGIWFAALSSRGYATVNYYIDSMGDGPLVPSPEDYDGDGKTDPALFAYNAPSHLNKYYVFCWHYLHSSENYRQMEPFYQLGREDCRPSNADPAPGDYDGDRRADFGVSWPDTTMWRMWCSHNNYESHDDADWGGLGFRPVQR
jgi:hypothetical protein